MNSFNQSRAGFECIACGGRSTRELWVSENFIYGSGKDEVNLTVNIPELHCDDCGMAYTDDRAEVARHNAACKHLKINTPEEIISIREQAGLNQKDFAEISRIGRASLSRWETGDVFQNGSIDNLIFLLQYPENIQRLQARFRVAKTIQSQSSVEKTSKNKFRCLSAEQIGNYRKRSEKFDLFAVAA